MALGPQMVRQNRQYIDAAEAIIDRRIELSKSRDIDINADTLDISREEWDNILKPKYLAAGWTSAEFHSDQHGGSWISLR